MVRYLWWDTLMLLGHDMSGVTSCEAKQKRPYEFPLRNGYRRNKNGIVRGDETTARMNCACRQLHRDLNVDDRRKTRSLCVMKVPGAFLGAVGRMGVPSHDAFVAGDVISLAAF